MCIPTGLHLETGLSYLSYFQSHFPPLCSRMCSSQTTQLIIERRMWLDSDAPVQFPQCTSWLFRCNWLRHVVFPCQYKIKCCTVSKIVMIMGPNIMKNLIQENIFVTRHYWISLHKLARNVGVLRSHLFDFIHESLINPYLLGKHLVWDAFMQHYFGDCYFSSEPFLLLDGRQSLCTFVFRYFGGY